MEFASKGVAGTALGLGIAGTALGLGAIGGLFGTGNKSNNCGWGWNNNNYGCINPWLAGAAFNNWNGYWNGGYNAAELTISQKECEDNLALTRALYEAELKDQNERFSDRQTIDREMFGIYKSQIDADFNLYKNQRDNYDILAKELNDLKAHVAVNDAVRPYQDKLIQCEIADARKDAKFMGAEIVNYVDKLDCRNIKGINCLPNEPTVTGLLSNNPYCCRQITTSSTTPAA